MRGNMQLTSFKIKAPNRPVNISGLSLYLSIPSRCLELSPRCSPERMPSTGSDTGHQPQGSSALSHRPAVARYIEQHHREQGSSPQPGVPGCRVVPLHQGQVSAVVHLRVGADHDREGKGNVKRCGALIAEFAPPSGRMKCLAACSADQKRVPTLG